MNVVIVGSGLAGLVSAQRVLAVDPGARVTVVDRAMRPGGLLAGIRHGDVSFDIGTHIFQESGDAFVDGTLLAAVPPEDLLHFAPGEGDIAGSVYEGRLQLGSHFPDLRQRADAGELRRAMLAHVATLAEVPALDRLAPLTETSTKRFGALYTERVLVPLMASVYERAPDELCGLSAWLPGLTRVVIDDHSAWERQCSDERYRAVFGVPDQRALPARFRHGRRNFTARGGSGAFIEGLAQQLRDRGVEIVSNASVCGVHPSSGIVDLQVNGAPRRALAERLILATGAVEAARLLGLDIGDVGFERPLPLHIVDVVLSESGITDLCYVYGLDSACPWYRVTLYRGFSGDRSDRRLTIEVVGEAAGALATSADGPAMLVEQLRSVGLLRSSGIERAFVRRQGGGFPAPTVRNLAALTEVANRIAAELPENVLVGGVGARPGLFFQNEVVLDLVHRIAERW